MGEIENMYSTLSLSVYHMYSNLWPSGTCGAQVLLSKCSSQSESNYSPHSNHNDCISMFDNLKRPDQSKGLHEKKREGLIDPFVSLLESGKWDKKMSWQRHTRVDWWRALWPDPWFLWIPANAHMDHHICQEGEGDWACDQTAYWHLPISYNYR